MSRFITQNKDETYLEEIESLEVCRWRINDICCNDSSPYLADYPSPFCKCESKEDCPYFEKEDRIINKE